MKNISSNQAAELTDTVPAAAPQNDSHSAVVDLTPSLLSVFRSFLTSALLWFRFGFFVIPVRPGTKQTAVKWDEWLQWFSLRKVTRHWAQHPTHEVGFIPGDEIVVLDADSAAAVAALEQIEIELGVEPLLVTRTNRGAHHFFRAPAGMNLRTTTVTVGESADRIDIKTGRTMVVLAPSTGKQIVKLGGNVITSADLSLIDPRLLERLGVGAATPANNPTQPEAPAARSGTPDMALIHASLKRLDPDSDYDTWLRVGMIIFNATNGSVEGFEAYLQWSSRGSKFKGEAEIAAKWASFKPGHARSIGIGSIARLVKAAGHDWTAVLAEARGDVFPTVETVVVR